MPHLHRFYVPPETPSEDLCTLTGEEAHHALRAARVRPGDAVVLFDGQGRELEGTVADATRRGLCVAVQKVRMAPPPRTRLTLVQAWLNDAKSAESLIRRGTEVGIARFRFFPAERSARAPKATAKWDRMAIEACKQCGRTWLPCFEVAASLEAALQDRGECLLLATGSLPPVPVRDAVTGSSIALLVGPEGDFTAHELDLAQGHGATPISLGPFTYRSEIAAVVAAALILYERGELGPQAAHEVAG